GSRNTENSVRVGGVSNLSAVESQIGNGECAGALHHEQGSGGHHDLVAGKGVGGRVRGSAEDIRALHQIVASCEPGRAIVPGGARVERGNAGGIGGHQDVAVGETVGVDVAGDGGG